jgi:AcrR family transcriptional regulator
VSDIFPAIDPVDIATEPTRRRLTRRQADTVKKLTAAAMEEIRAAGYEGLTVRSVASRAGVAAATAYMYFSSKEHLLAEVYWRELRALPPIADDERDRAERVTGVLREICLMAAAEPDLAAAATVSLLDSSPDVHDLRARIGLVIRQRLLAALGADYDHAVLTALEFAYSGAMVHAGMGFVTYEQVADRLAETARLIMKGS